MRRVAVPHRGVFLKIPDPRTGRLAAGSDVQGGSSQRSVCAKSMQFRGHSARAKS